jgi:methyl-accepting chemotaxis protein
MDHVTQSTAASAEESASASEELSAQAEALNHIVKRLREMVGGSASEDRRARVEPPAARRAIAKRSLEALKSAVARPAAPPVKPAAAPVFAGRQERDAFPMEDNFIEG